MKKLLSTIFVIAVSTTAGAVIAQEVDEAMAVAPNAQNVIVSTPTSGPVRYDQDESMDVAPNATLMVEQTTYTWDEDYSQP